MAFVLQGDYNGFDNYQPNDQIRNEDSLLFTAMMGNKVQIVKDYLAMNVDIAWNVFWSMNKPSAGKISLAGGGAPAFAANATGAGDGVLDRLNMATYEYYYIQQANTKYVFAPTVGFSGKVPNSGFDWSLSQVVSMYFDQNFYKDNDPTNATHHGEPYALSGANIGEDGGAVLPGRQAYNTINPNTTGNATYGDDDFGGFFESVYLYTKLHLAYEIPALFCTVKC